MNSQKRERVGWYMYDWANSAFTTTVVTVFMGPYITTIAKNCSDSAGFLKILSIPVYHGSYFGYLVSLSVILQVLLLPLIGSIADYTKQKKFLLALFAYLGSISTMLMFFLQGSHYLFGGLLFVLANVCFGASVVIYNSFLSDISLPERRDSVSSIGWAIGYIGGGILLLLNLILFSFAEKLGLTTGLAVRICLSSAGLWWAIFTIFPMLWIRKAEKSSFIINKRDILTSGFKNLIKNIKSLKEYKITLLFLIAFLLYNDGVQAVITLSALFGQQELNLSISTLTQVILMVQFVGFFGNLLFNSLSKKIGTKSSILISIIIWLVALIYAYGFLKDVIGFYMLGILIALVLGGTQALSRSLFSLLIPKGMEAEFFGVYEISDSGTSWLGPLLFGLALQITFSYRIALLSLILFFVAGGFMLLFLNIKKGIAEAGNDVPLKV